MISTHTPKLVCILSIFSNASKKATKHFLMFFKKKNGIAALLLLGSFLFINSSKAQMRITEYMYSGANGEFIELTNVGNTSINLTGWSQDDATRNPGAHSLSSFGTVQPGESVILTEASASAFRTAWNLCANQKVIGGITTDNLGRSDEINLYDASNALVDRLTYNDQGSGSVKGPRTDTKSAWPSAAALGANNASLWTLSSSGDSEASYASTGGDIGSPGKSTRATASYNSCAPANGTPTIVMDVTNTSNYIDGGASTSPTSPYTVSAALSDPTDEAKGSGIYFTVADGETAAGSLTVTANSSNTTVVPLVNLNLSGSGSATRNLNITPAAIGYSTITVTVSDGTNTASYVISYAASAASSTPNSTFWHSGTSDGSAVIAIDDNNYIVADDEENLLNVYSRTTSGLQLKSYNYTSNLSLPDPSKPEVDVEAATKSPSN
jgi:hypothetical protein